MQNIQAITKRYDLILEDDYTSDNKQYKQNDTYKFAKN